MKFYYTIVFLLVLFGLTAFPSQTKATHVVGSDISYACTSTPGIFEITLIIFRKCDGGAATLCPTGCGAACPQTMQLQGADPGCSSSTFSSITLNLYSVRDADIKPNCPSAKNTCTNMGCVTGGTYTPAVERYEFKGFVNIGATSGIPASCCNVRVSWQLCCRNSNIATGAADANFYVDAVINRCYSVSPCNSSPTFTADPFITVCGGENVIYNNGGFDPDGDSLSFAFTPALADYGSPVLYTPPFAFDRPMPWTGSATGAFPAGIRCDPVNGDIKFTPPNTPGGTFAGVIAVEVKQWKKISGTPSLVGVTRRDIQMIVRGDCAPNVSPRFTTIPSDSVNIPKTQWKVCAGEQLCFTIHAKDTDFNPPLLSDTTYLSWDGTIAGLGATFTPIYNPATRSTNGPREDSYQFCWTPAEGLARTNPYIFTVGATDSKCPNPGRLRQGFSITVLSRPKMFTEKIKKNCGKWQIGIVNLNPGVPVDSTSLQIGKQPFDYSYAGGAYTYENLSSTPVLQFSQPGKYLIKLLARSGNCLHTIYDTLVVDTMMTAITHDTLTCQGNTITLSASAQNGTSPLTYRWYNSIRDTALAPLNAPNYTQPNLTVTAGTERHYTVLIRDLNGCVAIDSVKVSLYNGVQSAVVNPVKCFGGNDGSITVTVANATSLHQYKIDSLPFQSSNTFNNLPAGPHTITVQDTSSCSSVQSITIKQPALLKDTLTNLTAQTCIGTNTGSIVVNAKGGTAPYRFSIDSILFDTTRSFTNLTPGIYKIHILDSNMCYTSVTRNVLPADTIKYTTTVKNVTCSGFTTGEIKISATGGKKPFTYKLGTGAFVNDSVFKNLGANGYSFTVKDANNCTLSFTDTVKSPAPLQQTTLTKNPNCFGGNNGLIHVTVTGGTAPYLYRKTSTGAYDTISQFNNLTGGTYPIGIKDNNNCVLTVSKTLVQPALITTNISMLPTTCFENNDGQLGIAATGGIPPYLYSVDSSAFGSSNTFTNVAGGTRTVIVRDSVLCEKAFTKIVTRAPKVDAGIAQKNSSCFNRADGSITITPLVGKSPFTFNINGGAFTSASVFTNLLAGNYNIIIKDSLSCLDTASVVITQPAQIIAGSITGITSTNLHQVDTYSITPQTGKNYLWFSQKGVFTTPPTDATVAVRWDTAGVGGVAAYVYDDITCGDTATMVVTIGSVGLNELSKQWGLNVYPNPAKNILNIRLQQLPEQTQIQLYDVQGKLVLQQELKLYQQLNIETLSPGMYLLKIGAWSGQVIKE